MKLSNWVIAMLFGYGFTVVRMSNSVYFEQILLIFTPIIVMIIGLFIIILLENQKTYND